MLSSRVGQQQRHSALCLAAAVLELVQPQWVLAPVHTVSHATAFVFAVRTVSHATPFVFAVCCIVMRCYLCLPEVLHLRCCHAVLRLLLRPMTHYSRSCIHGYHVCLSLVVLRCMSHCMSVYFVQPTPFWLSFVGVAVACSWPVVCCPLAGTSSRFLVPGPGGDSEG